MAASMSDDARRGYTMLARLFLVVGGAFALLALVQMAGGFRLFNGNPLGVALIVLIIGVLLEWTVRTAPPGTAAAREDELGEGAADEGRADQGWADEGASDDAQPEGRDAAADVGERR
jgi:hypothetical protein